MRSIIHNISFKRILRVEEKTEKIFYKQTGNLAGHVFVCTNKKQGNECCADKGAEEFRKKLKEKFKAHPTLSKKIRINSAGCLDRCGEGIAISIYPQNQWLLNCKAKDIDSLYNEILAVIEK